MDEWKGADLPRVSIVNNARSYFLVIVVLYDGFLAELEAQSIVLVVIQAIHHPNHTTVNTNEDDVIMSNGRYRFDYNKRVEIE